MKSHSTKLCADSLRSHLSDNYDIKLKSGHAHEIVAAFFGHKSRIAMLADKEYPIDNMAGAELIPLQLSIHSIDQRLKSLQDLPPDLPPSHVLAEVIYSVLVAKQRLHQRLSMFSKDLASTIKLEMDVNIEHKDDGVLLTVDVGRHTDGKERLRDSKYVIHLPRIAANSGYGTPRIDETRYSGWMRKYSDEELLKKYPVPSVIA